MGHHSLWTAQFSVDTRRLHWPCRADATSVYRQKRTSVSYSSAVAMYSSAQAQITTRFHAKLFSPH